MFVAVRGDGVFELDAGVEAVVELPEPIAVGGDERVCGRPFVVQAGAGEGEGVGLVRYAAETALVACGTWW